MQLEKGHLYHIYNQGNNKRKIFFDRENYLFFLRKTRIYILPYGDILAWSLMPNHFHLMVLVREVEVASEARASLKAKPSLKPKPLLKTINQSIGI